MALTDEQEKAIKEELEKSKSELAALKKERDERMQNDADEKAKKAAANGGKPPEERPDKGKVDPDLAKSIADVQERIKKLEEAKAGNSSQGFVDWLLGSD